MLCECCGPGVMICECCAPGVMISEDPSPLVTIRRMSVELSVGLLFLPSHKAEAAATSESQIPARSIAM